MGEVISFISAKGGMGKTSIAVNIAHSAAKAGVKVLLIDCDVHTLGATYFYDLKGEEVKNCSDIIFTQRILNEIMYPDIYEREEARSILTLADGVDFIPAGRTAMLDKELTFNSVQFRDAWKRLTELMDRWVKIYDAILLDHSAGHTRIVELFLKVSSKIVLINEKGPLPLKATRDLYSSIRKEDKPIIYCCNKISGEQSKFEKEDCLIQECDGFYESKQFKSRAQKGQFVENLLDEGKSSDGKVMRGLLFDILGEFSEKIQSYLKTQERIKREMQEEINNDIVKNYLRKTRIFIMIAMFIGVGVGSALKTGLHFQISSSTLIGSLIAIVIFAVSQYVMIAKNEYKDVIIDYVKQSIIEDEYDI